MGEELERNGQPKEERAPHELCGTHALGVPTLDV